MSVVSGPKQFGRDLTARGMAPLLRRLPDDPTYFFLHFCGTHELVPRGRIFLFRFHFKPCAASTGMEKPIQKDGL